MCTIGAVFANKGVYVFKQCDLTVKRVFAQPEARGTSFRYLAMSREGRPGLWAGLNQAGVSFVAADAYTNGPHETPEEAVNALFKAYEASVATGTNARQSAEILKNFYIQGYQQTLFPGPDIALFADPNQVIFLEYTPGPFNHNPIREVVVNRGFFASTNHFRIQPDAVSYDSNHSTYLRLQRAETILEKDPSHNGIVTLLIDRYYGPSELSICRVAQYSGEYFTQATALFGSIPGQLTCEYQVNGNPIDNPLRLLSSSQWL